MFCKQKQDWKVFSSRPRVNTFKKDDSEILLYVYYSKTMNYRKCLLQQLLPQKVICMTTMKSWRSKSGRSM